MKDRRSASDPIEALVAQVRAGHDPSRDNLEAVLRTLRVWLGRRKLTPEDRDEVAADAVLRLTTAALNGNLDPHLPAGAWLRVVADHLALDRVRRRARLSTVAFDERLHGGATHDDQVAALFDGTAAADDVARAMRRAVDDGKFGIVRIMATWLDMASAEGAAPSTRRVAERSGVSHVTVQRALRTFGECLTIVVEGR